MTFVWVQMLWFLALVPILVLLYILAQRRRQKYARDALRKGPGIRRHVPAALFIAALTVGVFALARPTATVTLPSEEGTAILCVDVSGSMAATDVKPSRMEAVKEGARTLITGRPHNVRVGIVTFSSDAALIQPPTNNSDLLLAAVDRLHPERYTAIGSAIQMALDTIFGKEDDSKHAEAQTSPQGQLIPAPPDQEPPAVAPGSYKSAVIVLLTDGQNTEGPDPLDIADKAANRGVRVFTIGVGTKEGAVLSIPGTGWSFRVFLDEPTLRQIAAKTAGIYYKASSKEDLQRIYQSLATRLMVEREKTEITALFVAAVMALFLAGGAFSLLWFNRLL